jgi:periplasmic divalent cation tolerance protein
MMSTGDFLVVFITAANADEAEKISAVLVEERLAACVNVITGCRSIYRWNGELVKDDEVLMVVKTARRRFAALEKRVTALHSYDVPEIIAVELSELSAGYEKFLVDSID